MINKVDNIVFTDNIDYVSQTLFSSENKYCLIVCKIGAIQITIGKEVISLQSNEMVILRTEVFVGHFMRTPDFSGYLLSIDNRMVQELMMEMCRVEPRWWNVTKILLSNPIIKLENENYRKLLDTYFALLKLYMEGEQTEYRKRTYMLLAKAASYEVLAEINKEFIKEEVVDAFSSADRLARDFINDLKNDDGTHREVAWYAARLNITPKYLSHVCKEKLKMTASSLIQKVMSERIKYFLLNTDMNIKEIAYKLKFPTVSFFCKYVRQHIGASPLEVRNKERV